MSYQFRTEHYEAVLKAGDMVRCLPALTWHLEDPRVGQCYPNYYVARLASNFVKVVLTGSGGDELFAGYPWRYYRAVVNQDFDALRQQVLRASGAGLYPTKPRAGLLQRRMCGGRCRTSTRSRSSARQLPDGEAPQTPGGLREPLALPRGTHLPAWPVRRRGQAEHGARPRESRAIPRQRSRRVRASACRSG